MDENITEEQTIEQLIARVTHPKKRMFLDNYYKLINTKKTAVAIGVNECTPYDWMHRDKLFNQTFQLLKKRIDSDRLEEIEYEIHQRAMGGVSKQSDILLMFEAKALDPGKYREKPVAIPITGDIIVRHLIPRPGDAIQGQRETKQLPEATNEAQTG